MAVDAAAGSGKTAVLIHRILRIVGCDPENPGSGDWQRLDGVLAITFTEKAAGELRAKLRPFVPLAERYRLDQAWIGTFHASFARMLRRFGPAIGLDPSFELIDGNAAGMLSRACIEETLLQLLADRDARAVELVEEQGYKTIFSALEELMQFRWHAARALAERNGAEASEAAAIAALERVFTATRQRYRERLVRLGALDFQELEIETHRLLAQESRAAACRRLFTHLLVDEYQDTNDLQTELILRLFDPAQNRLFIVGDEAQSIYRFRGANVSCFSRVRDEIERRGGRTIRLAHNFRSAASIIGFVNTAQGVLAPGLFADPSSPKPMEATLPDEKARPSVIALVLPASGKANVQALREREAGAIARLVAGECAAGRRGFGDWAILMRAMTDVEIYEAALRRHRIPCTTAGGRGFLERPEVADLMAALRFAHDPRDAVALLTLMRSPIGALSDDRIVELAGGDGRALFASLEREEELGLIRELPALAVHMRPSELLRRVINACGLEAIWGRLDPSGAANLNLDRLMTLSRALEREMPTPLSEFSAFLQEMRGRGEKLCDTPAGADARQAVRLMSVHAAKGLEFPVVILPDLFRPAPTHRDPWIFARGDGGEGSGVAFKQRDPQNPFGTRLATERFDRLLQEEKLREGNESRRLLYVAMTRAASQLVLPVHGEVRGKGHWHEWIREALRSHDGAGAFAAIDAGSITAAPRTEARPDAGAAVAARPRDRGMTSHLSVSALESYGVCPMLYYLKYVLGLPASEVSRSEPERIAPNVAGSIVHALLAAATEDDEELRALARAEAFAAGISPAKRELQEFVGIARKAIELSGRERLAQGLRELPFEYAVNGSLISGTIDWLLPAEGGLEIVDFKTGLAESARAEARAAQYEVQLQAYALAAEAITGEPVAATSLVFPEAGSLVRHAWDAKRRESGQRAIARICGGIAACDYAVPAAPPCESCIFHRNAMCWEDRTRKHGTKSKGSTTSRNSTKPQRHTGK